MRPRTRCVKPSDKTELAAWETANEEHAQLMKRRQAKQTAAWKTAQKGPAKIAPPASAQKGPAKTPAAAAPLSAEELRLVSSPTRSCALGGEPKLRYSSSKGLAEMAVYFRTWLVYWLIV